MIGRSFAPMAPSQGVALLRILAQFELSSGMPLARWNEHLGCEFVLEKDKR